MQGTIGVVIPIYRPLPPSYEAFTLEHNTHILNNYPILLVAPETLDCSFYKNVVPDARIIRFADKFFHGTEGYNELCLSSRFWKAFESYSHVLICQLDAIVYSDQTAYWNSLPLDYVGSAVCKYDMSTGKFIRWIRSQNGGLSFRNVEGHTAVMHSRRIKCLLKEQYAIHRDLIASTRCEDFSYVVQIVRRMKFYGAMALSDNIFSHIDERNGAKISHRVFTAEDQFWCRLAPKFEPECFRVATLAQAQDFGFQNGLERLSERYYNRPPFGCHGPEKVQALYKFLCLQQYPVTHDECLLWNVAHAAGLVPALRAEDIPAELAMQQADA